MIATPYRPPGHRASLGLAARAVAALAAAVPGGLTLLGATTGETPWHGALALNAPTGSFVSFINLLAVAAGIGLLLLAGGLWAGKRRAADVATATLCAVAVIRLGRELPDELTLAALALAGLMVLARRHFARGGESSPRLLLGTAALAAVASSYFLAAILMVTTDRVRSVEAALSAGAAGRVPASMLVPDTYVGLALDLLALLGLSLSARYVWAVLRPARAADGHTAAAHARAATIVAQHGSDSLDTFALREDKAFHFAHGGMLAYRTLHETAVVSGDPIGPPGCVPALLADFRAHANERGWDVVVTAASGRHLGVYADLGMRALHIGNEAVVDPSEFTLEGRAIRKVRQSVHRVQRYGWSVEVVEDQRLGPDLVDELEAVERQWRAQRPRVSGFAMTLGRLWAVDDDVSGIYVLGRDPDGEVRAFLRFVDFGQGLSLDVMRRLGGEPNGLNEALVVAALEHAREHGLREMSLNFAGFAHLMAADAALTRGQRALRLGLSRLQGRFQLERLVRFNDKFRPAWRPRYLIYDRRTRLPLAGLRVLQAEAYLRGPRSRPLTTRWCPPPRPAGVALSTERSTANR